MGEEKIRGREGTGNLYSLGRKPAASFEQKEVASD